ncbi:MAG: ABC transporter permease [Bacteroidales bacterium]
MLKLSFFIAKRYLFAKKSHNVINLISLISAIGVTVGSFALVVALSIYNGIDNLVQSLHNTLVADLKISPVQGKVFNPYEFDVEKIKQIEGIAVYTENLEENALLKYAKKQHIATLRGVEQSFIEQSGLSKAIVEGTPWLKKGDTNMAIVGKVIAHTLEIRPNFFDLLSVYVPKRGAKLQLTNPTASFNYQRLKPSAIFSIEMESDSRYVFAPIKVVRELLNYTNEVSSIELYLSPKANLKNTQAEVKKIVGNTLEVKNRYEQNEMLYRMMQGEKWTIFFILAFILLIASFNSIGSITMLIIEKKKDIKVLFALGAYGKMIRQIFMIEGVMISFLGCIIGVVLGVLTCWAQQIFGFIKLSGSFVVNSYPVQVQTSDILLVLALVMFIGYLAATIPVRYVLRKIVA